MDDLKLAQEYLASRTDDDEEFSTFTLVGRFLTSKGIKYSIANVQAVSQSAHQITMRRFALAARDCAKH